MLHLVLDSWNEVKQFHSDQYIQTIYQKNVNKVKKKSPLKVKKTDDLGRIYFVVHPNTS